MALLDSVLGMQMQGQQNPFEQFRRMQADPFTRMIPGTEYLGQLGGMGGGMSGGFGDSMPGNGFDQVQAVDQAGGNTDFGPTDFAGTPPGLPNLPDNMQGFGFGQNAPQMNVNNNLRQSLIQSLIEQMMQQAQGPFNGGFTGGMGGGFGGGGMGGGGMGGFGGGF